MNILEEIVGRKRKEVEESKKNTSISDLVKLPDYSHETYPFSSFIRDPSRTGIIAEFKRKSPSKGWINQTADVESTIRGYGSFGASAVSVLTDEFFFGGSLVDLSRARKMAGIPVLRKDFIIDEYQLFEAKAYGADVVLLIAACLKKDELKQLARIAQNLGLNVLMEVHMEEELESINDYIDVVGINNRNLKTFEVDLENSIRLAKQIPSICKISESGIDSLFTMEKLRDEGFDGFLIGEKFMREKVPGLAFKKFIYGKI